MASVIPCGGAEVLCVEIKRIYIYGSVKSCEVKITKEERQKIQQIQHQRNVSVSYVIVK